MKLNETKTIFPKSKTTHNKLSTKKNCSKLTILINEVFKLIAISIICSCRSNICNRFIISKDSAITSLTWFPCLNTNSANGYKTAWNKTFIDLHNLKKTYKQGKTTEEIKIWCTQLSIIQLTKMIRFFSDKSPAILKC